jgi:predicted transcriptional regulator
MDDGGVEVDAMSVMSQSAVEAPRSRLSYSAIATYAEEIAREHGVIDPGGHVNVHELLMKLGGEVVVDDRAESLEVREPGDFTVIIPTHTSQLRDRFTIAHELGHYFLHYRAPDRHRVGERTSTFTRLGRNVAETQANVFASNVLMPTDHFKDAFVRESGDIVAVAQNFGVSVPAAKVRAEYLGLLT